MSPVRVGIATQTPLLRPAGPGHPGDPEPIALLRKAAGRVRATVSLRDPMPVLAEPEPEGPMPEVETPAQLELNPGGVSRMVLQTLRAWRGSGWRSNAHWFALQPAGPRRLTLESEGIELHHLGLPRSELAAYARTKERLWANIHGLPAPRFGVDDFRFYARYNGLASDAILEQGGDLDVAYVHDFQLLQVGALVGLAAPCVLRWHVPFDPKLIPPYTRAFLVRMMEAFDAVIVSTRRDLEGLSNSGYHGRVRQLYPHSDPQDWKTPDRATIQAFSDRWSLTHDTRLMLCVARMDPMKRQDLAIQAMARLAARHPDARLMLVGNGSFSGTRGAGLGLSKSAQWKAHLMALTRELGVEDRVLFTGWLPDAHLRAAYARADVVLLPSDLEGFGLTPFEAWAQGKPCVVTSGCGSSEIVQDKVNGIVVQPNDAEALAEGLDNVLAHRNGADRMGEAGRIALTAYAAPRAAREEAIVLEDAVQRYGSP